MPPNPDSGRQGIAMPEEAVIRYLFDRVYSKGELHHVEELVASDFIGERLDTNEVFFGPAGMKTHVIRLRKAFYGFVVKINELRVEADAVEVHWTAQGTHERRFMGIEPTCTIGQAGEEPHGNRINVPGITEGTMKIGKIHKIVMSWNREKLYHQLDHSGEHGDDNEVRGNYTTKNHETNGLSRRSTVR